MVVVRSQARAACARDWLAFLGWRKDGEKGNREPSNPTLTFPVGFGFFLLGWRIGVTTPLGTH